MMDQLLQKEIINRNRVHFCAIDFLYKQKTKNYAITPVMVTILGEGEQN